MPILKSSSAHTTFVFVSTSYVEKLCCRNVFLDNTNPSSITLRIDLSHYSKRKSKNLEDSDFLILQSNCNSISKLDIRDSTIAKMLASYSAISNIEINIGVAAPLLQLSVKSQNSIRNEVSFYF